MREPTPTTDTPIAEPKGGPALRSRAPGDGYAPGPNEGSRRKKDPMTTAIRARLWTALVTAAALTTAACASSPEGSSGDNGDTILIGQIAGTTGAYGTTGQAMVNGAQMAIDELN